jgi:hypothetical protein
MRLRLAIFSVSTILLGATLMAAAIAPRSTLAVSSTTDSQAPRPSQLAAADNAVYQQSVEPLIQKYCAGCHSGAHPPNGINLSVYPDSTSVVAASSVWEKVSDNIDAQRMPPAGMPHPTTAESTQIVSWIATTLSHADGNFVDPGHVTLHRLNREEYNNTVDDLFGITLRPADAFPSDDVGYGFDNIADVLSVSPLLLEKYVDAAEEVAHAAIIAPESLGHVTGFTPTDFTIPGQAPTLKPNGDWILYTTSQIGVDYDFPYDDDYILRVRGYGEQAGPDPAKMAIELDYKPQDQFDVPQTDKDPAVFEVKVHVTAGIHHVSAAFLNDYYNASDPNPNNRDRNLVINRIAVVGPVEMPSALPASETNLITKWPSSRAQYDNCARVVLKRFASLAFRRPVQPDELDRLVDVFHETCSQGASYQRGLQVAIEAVLVSPNFLYRIEIDPKPDDPKAVQQLGSYEMASRLSYFLWSSMPDAELMRLAAENKLQQPAVLDAEVTRMLQSPKANALATNFAGQWLELRKLQVVAPDPKQFPDFDDGLRNSMKEESETYFENIVSQDRSILEFLDSDYTFLNETLARHYGISGVEGDQFRLVHLPDHTRGGVLTQASVLTVTSNPTRTSPVKRGRWVLEQLLGTPPPPPPPGVPQLDDGSHGPLTGTLRQRMIQHRQDPACAACHQTMDPIGFGLENFDAVGAWRTMDDGAPIDSSGVLPDGSKFSGPAELKQILMSRKDQFTHAFAEKMLIYALGRGLEPTDRQYVDGIAEHTEQNGYRFTALITGIVESPPFREDRGSE